MASRFPPDKQPGRQAAGEQETLLEFPCKFPVKVMGRLDDDFETLVKGIVLAHARQYAGEPVKLSSSGTGKYVSVTVTIEATSKGQLDRIYQDLTNCEQVLVAL